MIHRPLVSVVVPTYNQVDFVEATIESVLAQDYPHVQLIVTDDGSTDGTREVIETCLRNSAGRVQFVSNAENRGISTNVNRGLRSAQGEFLAWLGGDDLMLPGRISAQVATLQAHPEAVGCTHDAEVFESPTDRSLGLFSAWINGSPGVLSGDVSLWFHSSYAMLPSTFMYRRKYVPRTGYDTRLRYAADWLFDVETFSHGPVIGSDAVLTRYRRHVGNVTGSGTLKELALEDNLVALAIVESRLPQLARLVKKRRATLLMGAARRKWQDGDRVGSRALLRSAVSVLGLFGCAAEGGRWAVRRHLLGRRPTRLQG